MIIIINYNNYFRKNVQHDYKNSICAAISYLQKQKILLILNYSKLFAFIEHIFNVNNQDILKI